jgi:hypothetical protein
MDRTLFLLTVFRRIMMTGTSTLDPDNFPGAPDRTLGTGHGLDALGPSDTSDSGSDVMGGPGLGGAIDNEMTDFDSGNTSDMDTGLAGGTAGPDLGDADFSGDSDANGTGERAAAGRDSTARDGGDIGTDHIERIPDTALTDDDTDFLSTSAPGQAPQE